LADPETNFNFDADQTKVEKEKKISCELTNYGSIQITFLYESYKSAWNILKLNFY